MEKPPYCRIYLLTVWQEKGQQAQMPVWRFQLEDPHTGQRRAFANALALAAALQSGFIGSEDATEDFPTPE